MPLSLIIVTITYNIIITFIISSDLASINPGQHEVHILITLGTFQTLQATQSPIASWIQWESILAKFAQSLKAIKSCEFRDSFIKVGENEDNERITSIAMRLHLFFWLLLFLLLLEQNYCILYQGSWKDFRDFPFVVFVRVWPISINPTSLSNCFNFLDTSWNLMPIISTKLSKYSNFEVFPRILKQMKAGWTENIKELKTWN